MNQTYWNIREDLWHTTGTFSESLWRTGCSWSTTWNTFVYEGRIKRLVLRRDFKKRRQHWAGSRTDRWINTYIMTLTSVSDCVNRHMICNTCNKRTYSYVLTSSFLCFCSTSSLLVFIFSSTDSAVQKWAPQCVCSALRTGKMQMNAVRHVREQWLVVLCSWCGDMQLNIVSQTSRQNTMATNTKNRRSWLITNLAC